MNNIDNRDKDKVGTIQKRKIKLVLSKQFERVECKRCGTLLYKRLRKSVSFYDTIEIKCRKCGALNTG